MKTDDMETLQGFIELACVGKENVHVANPITVKELVAILKKLKGCEANDNSAPPLDDPTL